MADRWFLLIDRLVEVIKAGSSRSAANDTAPVERSRVVLTHYWSASLTNRRCRSVRLGWHGNCIAAWRSLSWCSTVRRSEIGWWWDGGDSRPIDDQIRARWDTKVSHSFIICASIWHVDASIYQYIYINHYFLLDIAFRWTWLSEINK